MSARMDEDAPDTISDYERPVGKMLARARNESYVAVQSLSDAKLHDDAVVILEGDYGGQIYVVCPASLIACEEAALVQLVSELDRIEWGAEGSGDNATGVYYERLPLGVVVAGGMGGGLVTAGIWVHEKLVSRGLVGAVEAVIAGRRSSVL